MNKKTAIYHPNVDSKTTPEESTEQSANSAQPSIASPVADKDSDVEARRQQIDEKVEAMPTEYGGRSKDKGLEPTRYNDWEFKGRCIDF